MKYPSKRAAALVDAEVRKNTAFHANDHKGFAKAVADIAEAEKQPDIYTCMACGVDFPDGPHVDFLVSAMIEYGDDGAPISDRWADFGVNPAQGQQGRRLKFCGPCVAKWHHAPFDYINLR